MKRLDALLGVSVVALVGATAGTSADPLTRPLPMDDGSFIDIPATIVAHPVTT